MLGWHREQEDTHHLANPSLLLLVSVSRVQLDVGEPGLGVFGFTIPSFSCDSCASTRDLDKHLHRRTAYGFALWADSLSVLVACGSQLSGKSGQMKSCWHSLGQLREASPCF